MTINYDTNDDFYNAFNDSPSTPPLEMDDSNDIDKEIANEFKITNSITDTERGKSKANKLSSAYKHINYALKNKIADCPYKTMADIPQNGYNADLIGKLANYFANHAKSRCNESLELLSCTTACGYMAAIKTYFNDKFR